MEIGSDIIILLIGILLSCFGMYYIRWSAMKRSFYKQIDSKLEDLVLSKESYSNPT